MTAGALDPVSGFGYATQHWLRSRSVRLLRIRTQTSFTLAGCNLNQIPAARLDPNAISLLNLYPTPHRSGITSNYANKPKPLRASQRLRRPRRLQPTQKEQIFVRFSYVDDPQFIPGPFGGVADGGSFQQGLQTAKSDQAVAGLYPRLHSQALVNVARAGFNHLHTTRFGPEGSTRAFLHNSASRVFRKTPRTAAFPAIVIGGLQSLGSNDFLPSDEVSQTLQITDDFTKIYGKHSFKMGIEYQNVQFNTLQPAYSQGEFDYNGNFAGVPGQCGDQTGRAQFLLTPTGSSRMPGGVSFVGGANQVHASNIRQNLRPRRVHLPHYFQDDWKVSPRLTLNLGLRWDYFSPISETMAARPTSFRAVHQTGLRPIPNPRVREG